MSSSARTPLPVPSYRLIVLTHGDSGPLAGTLASFAEHVTPAPAGTFLHSDGGSTDFASLIDAGLVTNLTASGSFGQRGFCSATGTCWAAAAQGDEEYVFWLEHDFRFVRPVDLAELAAVLEAEPLLAQMALYRNPVSREEHGVGGYLNRPDREYRPRHLVVQREVAGAIGNATLSWFEHGHYWTTNPSLFRRDLAASHRWPVGPECEGLFGFQLREERPGSIYGVWGRGEQWVEHVGVRSGSGY